ncbi:uncharacterized protein DUF3164 [Rhizobium sp. PP-CC-2G-626]|nr:uncharacterized protein DUF3164 [Rhizobium sp. PP-CC-2G-626]
MDAVIIADLPDLPIVEVNGKRYVEDVRGRLIPEALYDNVTQEAGKIEINGRVHVQDAEGRWTDWEMVKTKDQLQDELVRKIMAYARDLSAQITRFRRHTEGDLGAFMELLQQEYKVSVGGPGGNFMLRTFDDLQRVEMKVGKLMDFGPEIQAAKMLIDECLRTWSENADVNLRTIVLGAFEVDKKGKIDRQKVLDLKKYAIEDERWQRAMQAISDADRTVMVKEYLHFRFRKTHQDDFQSVTINLARA